MPFPKTNEEFLKLLKLKRVSNPENWISQDKPLKRHRVAQYLFLDALWNLTENPKRPTYTRQTIRFKRKRVEDSPILKLDPIILKIEEILDAGVDAEVISEVVMDAQYNMLERILYMLDDNLFGAEPKCSDELCYGIFSAEDDDELGKVPSGGPWSLETLLGAARPGHFPPLLSEGLYE